MRIILLDCFIFLPSKWNWPLGREENKESPRADSELDGNARQTKQRRLRGADHTQNADGTLRFEALSASEASLNPLKDGAHSPGKRTVNGIDTAAEYTDGVCSRSLVFLVAGTFALKND